MKSSDFAFVRKIRGISEHTLTRNGLRVLHREDTSAPVAAVMVTYHVGSRNEAVGHTGATHMLEHLMFKRSKKFDTKKGKDATQMLERIGAKFNATTYLDRTNYYEVVPKEHVEFALKMEADRMRNAYITDEDRKAEMTVVRNEFERGKNNPAELIHEALWAAAYIAHPYHHSTIGWREDIENVPIERLKEFYDTFYWPNNATLTILGDINEKSVLALAKKYFGAIPRSPHTIPAVYTKEPPQEGPRRVDINRPGSVSIVAVAHKTPHGLHSDFYALHVLSRVLNGGRSSRFQRNLVDKNLATDMWVFDEAFHDPGLFITHAFAQPGVPLPQIEKAILHEYATIAQGKVSEQEVERAKAQLETAVAFTRDGVFAECGAINEALAVGDWSFYATYLSRIARVKKKDVVRVAKEYLVGDRSTTGYLKAQS